MNIAATQHHYNENKLIWAIIASIVLHLAFVCFIPNFKLDIPKKSPVLEIEIQKLAPVAPEILPESEFIKPEPPKPIVKPKPKPKKKKPKPKPIPKPILEPEPILPPEPQEEISPPPVQRVIAVTPSIEKKSQVVAPPPPPVPVEPPPPSQVDIDNALGQYGGLLGRAIAKQKSYPKIAARRGWQGKVLLDLKIDGNGNVLSAKVKESSGHKVLDVQAVKMVKRAAPFPKPPLALRNSNFNLTVPVSFKLDSR